MNQLNRPTVLQFRVSGEQARMADLKGLLTYATAGEADERRAGLSARLSARAAWVQDLRTAEDGWAELTEGADGADQLIDEMTALTLTRLVRLQGLDTGVFDAAEVVIRHLSRVAGIRKLVLTHTSESESMNHTRLTVALRFPGSRIWDLPIVAHEFGHHAIAQIPHLEPVLADRRPLEAVVIRTARARETDDETTELAQDRANELVADAFATVVCGPCYPIACLALRVPPGPQADTARLMHPAWTERVATMRATLDAMTEQTGLPRYGSQRSDVVDPLVRSVLGRIPKPTPAAEQAGAGTVSAIGMHRPELIFRSGDKGIAVHSALRDRRPVPPPEADVLAVLDGVWRWRLKRADERDEAAICRLATDYCRAIEPGGTR